SELLLGEIQFVDAAIGQMVTELRSKGLLSQTVIVITSKHGQSPIDPSRFLPIPGHNGNNGTTPANLIADLLPWSESPLNPNGIGPTEDDISLLWLTGSANTAEGVGIIETSGNAAGMGELFYGPSITTMFNAPGLPLNGDPRTPDIIVTPNYGVV